jgi:acyl carrier protein
MTASRPQIHAKLCELLEPFNGNKIALTGATDISTDLNIDSVSVMDVVMEVEDHFDLDIPLNVLSETRTIDDLTGVVAERMKGN